jgi:hypothetical protein
MRRTLRSARPLAAGALLLIAGVAPAAETPASATLHVSERGKDSRSGTLPAPSASGTDGPIAIPKQARDEARRLLALMATGTFAAPEAPGGAEPPNGSASGSDADRLPADAGRVYRYVTTPLPGELRWQQIPWLLDLEEGVRRARAENRPLLLFVSGDEPLGRC